MVLCMFKLLKTVCPNRIYRFVALDWYIQALWLRPWHVQRLCLFKYEASPFLCLAIMVAFLKSLLCDRYRTVCRYEILFIYVLKLPNCIYVCSAIWLLGCCCWAQAGPCFASAAACSCEGKSCSSLPSFHISSFICDPFPLSMCTSLSWSCASFTHARLLCWSLSLCIYIWVAAVRAHVLLNIYCPTNSYRILFKCLYLTKPFINAVATSS